MSPLTFTSWLEKLDALCQKLMGGLRLDTLPDAPLMEFWRDGITPSDAFHTFVAEYWN
jgi:hypothetical protein